MSLLILAPHRDPQPWAIALRAHDPTLKIQIWPQVQAPAEVTFALCWRQPPKVWQQFPNLRCVSSMGAGVDHLIQDPDLPTAVPIVRLVDPLLAQSMFEYIGAVVMGILREFDRYSFQQAEQVWRAHDLTLSQHCTIGIMGLGQLGHYAAQKLMALGFRVVGWSRSPKQIAGVESFAGPSQRQAFLARSQILICLLPLTAQTRDVLNLELFQQLPSQAYVINVARGEHLVEADLLTAIATGHLRGACLDVFRQEPLPPTHPFWAHPHIRVTPHCSSITRPASVAAQIVANYQRAQARQPLLNLVSRARGY